MQLFTSIQARALSIIITLALGISLNVKAVTWPNRFTTNVDNAAASKALEIDGANTNSINNLFNPVISGPIRLFVLGDSKSIITNGAGIRNQWTLYFTNLPYWASNIVSFTNFAVTGFPLTPISNSYSQAIPLFAPPASGTNNLIIIRDGANDFPTNPSVASWIANYSNILSDIKGRTNCYSCIWDIQPRSDWPDGTATNRDAMNSALRNLTNWNYFVKSEKLVPNAQLTTLFVDGIHANTNGAYAEAEICDYAIRFGPQHFYDEPRSRPESASLAGSLTSSILINQWNFNTTYINTNHCVVLVGINFQITSAAVAGTAGATVSVNGSAKRSIGYNTAITTGPVTTANFGYTFFPVPAFGNFAITNSSSGAGNSLTLFGGDVTLLGNQ